MAVNENYTSQNFDGGSENDIIIHEGTHGEVGERLNTFNGGGGDDRLDGRAGRDIINGEDGNDTLLGGDGDDRVSGGKGTDTLTGGDGADRFVLALDIAAGTDTVTDFSVASGDILVVNTADGDETTLADLGVSVADSGNHANLIFGGAVVMTLNDIDHTLISDANFGDYFEVI